MTATFGPDGLDSAGSFVQDQFEFRIPSVIARSVSDEAIQIDTAVLDCFAFGSQ
jgi:hypothetical protein